MIARDAQFEMFASDHDVYGEIPVEAVLQGIYVPSANFVAKVEYVATADKTEFLLYAFHKLDPYDKPA